jgi:hypothetical protein
MSDKNMKLGPFSIGRTSSNETTVKTFSFKMDGADFRIDHKPRRKNKSPHRRALVHNQSDGLTMNWAKDYPGGVTIHGDLKVPDKLIVKNNDVIHLLTQMQNKINSLEKIYDMIDWEAMKDN